MNYRRSYRRALGAVCFAALAASPAWAADKSFLVSNGNWSTVGNWNPMGAPTAADNVFVGNTAGAVNGWSIVNVDSTVANLVVTDGMIVRTMNNALTVSGHTALIGRNISEAGTHYSSHVRVENGVAGTDFRTNTLTASDSATLRLTGGTFRADGLVDMQAGTSIWGSGVINLYANGATALRMNGHWNVDSSGMTVNQNGTGEIDLDGTIADDGYISLVQHNDGSNTSWLTINGTGLTDAYDETINLRGGAVLTMNLSEGWTLGANGLMNFLAPQVGNNGVLVAGSHAQLNGRLDIEGQNVAQFNAPVTFEGRADIGVFSTLRFQNDATLDGSEVVNTFSSYTIFNGDTTVIDATFRSDVAGAFGGYAVFNGATNLRGTLNVPDGGSQHKGTHTVSLASVINANLADLDGDGGTQWNVNAPLTVNAGTIESGSNVFDGTLNVNGGNLISPASLEMNVNGDAWTMNGTMNLTGAAGGLLAQTLRGDTMIVGGDLNVSGGNGMTARLRVAATGEVKINAGASLRLDGGSIANPNRIEGGSILGTGTLRATADHALVGSGTISAPITFTGNAELRASGGFLNINGAINDVGVIGTADSTGLLQVNNAWNTNVAERVELLGGDLRGAAVTNGGQIVGHGTVFVTQISNPGTIAAQGGELLINTIIDSIDLDGAGNTGIVRAESGNLIIADAPTTAFQGDAYVGAGRTMTFSQGWTAGSSARVNLTGTPAQPATVAGSQQTLVGATIVSGTGQFQISTNFSANSVTQTAAPSDMLVLRSNAFVTDGAAFNGPGELRNANGSVLTLDQNASVDIRVTNEGQMRVVNPGAGLASVHGFAQTASGELAIGLSGTVPGAQYDRLNVTTAATLGGRISLSVGGYNPAYLVSHEVLRADAITGRFATVNGIVVNATKYLAVTYDADSVFATAAIPGDANLDGNVNFDDLLVLAQNYGQFEESWVTGDFTGNSAVSFDDLLLTAQNYGSHLLINGAVGVDAGVSFAADWALAQSMVPEPATLVACVLLAPLAWRRR